MKLTKGTILKLCRTNNQTRKRGRTKNCIRHNKTFRSKHGLNLANRTLKHHD